jgi:hypothetical protein
MTGGGRTPRRRWPFVVAGAALAAAALAIVTGLVTLEHHVGAFGPAFAADGRSVWFVEREARGVSWGLGWEFFTPPANVHVFYDVVRLRRLDLASARAVTVETWNRTPLVGRTLQQYRGRLFVHLGVALRPRADGTVEYALGLAVPRVPASEVHQLRGIWASDTARRRGEWDVASFAPTGPSEPIIHSERELFEQPGSESFPAGIVMLDYADSTLHVLYRASGSRSSEPALAELLAASRKPDFDHLQEMTRIERERTAAHLREGASEGEALLRAGRDLRDLGYYPKPERWVASRVGPAQLAAHAHLPRLDIAPMAFQVGLFPDLEEAMASPGVEVDKWSGHYLRHRDFDASERLNALLDAGTRELLIGTDDRVFLLRLLPGSPATRGPGRAAR